MNLLSIIVEKNVEELQRQLSKQIESFKNEEIEIDENVTYHESFYTLEYSVKIESVKNYPISDFINIFKYCAANGLFEYIKLYEEPPLIQKLIDYDYYYFSAKERIEIQNIIKADLKSQSDRMKDANDEVHHRKFATIQKMMEHFKTSSQINLKGFITFRLKDYILELQEMIERAVEDFLMNKEYNEFIKLLKYFVDIQEAKIDTVHILFEEDSKYKLYDQYGNLVNNEYLRLVATEMVDKDINYEDLLISSLITIAPNQVFIHKISNLNNVEIIKTISRVFVNKVKVCDSCDWCKVKVKVNVEKE
ncbi:putative sporulation protein YtxC [Clostridium formicaceticum]|uniref:YtxC-like family protein n=1 Tax=Clostridium formicaceticum TaxID=1497 RepID=A0AAC9RIP2_9CLOT|nr:putative sporulation protein YtxC [Clostridium formicaceticum]AOY76379.1 hypothetical protein BJL90_10965 [Clostridium formicaceticum]ARE86771.1 YtxC-like family protein [Clostridium formicaceticum]